MNKRNGIYGSLGRLLGGGLLLLVLGCAGTGDNDLAPLAPGESNLIRQTGRELFEGNPNWEKSFAKLSKNPNRVQAFVMNLVHQLVERMRVLRAHPDSFGRVLQRDKVLTQVMKGLEKSANVAVGPIMRLLCEARAPMDRALGAEVAGRLGNQFVAPLCRKLATEPPPHVGASCIRALALMAGNQEASTALIKASRTGDYRVRGAALLALGRQSGIHAQEILVATVREERDAFVVRKAVEGLGYLGVVEGVVPLLIDYLEARRNAADPAGWRMALVSLRKLTGKNFGPRVDAWRRWWAGRSVDEKGR